MDAVRRAEHQEQALHAGRGRRHRRRRVGGLDPRAVEEADVAALEDLGHISL
jgi:hypothetical protein